MVITLITVAFLVGWWINEIRWRYTVGKHLKDAQAFQHRYEAENVQLMHTENLREINVLTDAEILGRLSRKARDSH